MTDDEILELAKNAASWRELNQVFHDLSEGNKLQHNGVEIGKGNLPSQVYDRLKMAKDMSSGLARCHELLKDVPKDLNRLRSEQAQLEKDRKKLADDIAKHNFNVEKFASDILRKYRS